MHRISALCQEWRQQNLLLPVWLEGTSLKLVNQHALPHKYEVLEVSGVDALANAIRDMTIRGSGAIGTAGAYGLLLAAYSPGCSMDNLRQAGRQLCGTRPTAINLMKTTEEILTAVQEQPAKALPQAVAERVCDILCRQLDYEKRLGEYGAALINEGDCILTHCHSGALAGSGYGGRALSVIRRAHEQGKRIHVYTSETRPYLQGARITAYELDHLGIPHTLITDGMSGYLDRLGKIQKVVVGSDRVAANGDLINKIGTYMHALAAKANDIPFYSATSVHTVDYALANGMQAPVEFRESREITHILDQCITAPGTQALYPSFDVTPAALISGYITEKGVVRPPYDGTLPTLAQPAGSIERPAG